MSSKFGKVHQTNYSNRSSSKFMYLVNFKFTDYGTTDHGSSNLPHLVNFKFTDVSTDWGHNTFTHLVNFKFIVYGTMDLSSSTFCTPISFSPTADHGSSTLNTNICG